MGEESVVNLYFGHLADHYAERLVEFRCDNNVSLSQDTRFPLLQLAHVTCREGSGHEFPRLNPETLEELFIYDAPPSLDLGVFAADNDSPDIVFPKLKRLQLLYRGDDNNHDDDFDDDDEEDSNMQVTHEDVRPWQFHFPQLQAIGVICRWSRCPHLEDAVFPAAMESFNIVSNATLLTAVAAKSLPTTRILSLEVVMNPDNTPSVFAAINTIMSNMRPCKRAKLKIADEDLPVLPGDITFAGLTHLDIASPTSMRTIVGLVQNLRQLVYLEIRNYNIHDIPPEVAVPAPNKPELLPPLDTRIEMLGLHRLRASGNEKHSARVWRYLLLRMPSLKRVALGGVPRKIFGRFVSSYAQRYPHLPNITLLGK
ncbi:hypothetical protein H4R21_000677 [Coemansia helicoidea]|uniref:Uncharacterized protein n=1 Tax=Coemansia helicoidea TaxID=1286919 RepID=A0ACC1LF45_9FUNG|nr:hypothetical protein H4R21_000677 [Coemansia helicoidea]